MWNMTLFLLNHLTSVAIRYAPPHRRSYRLRRLPLTEGKRPFVALCQIRTPMPWLRSTSLAYIYIMLSIHVVTIGNASTTRRISWIGDSESQIGDFPSHEPALSDDASMHARNRRRERRARARARMLCIATPCGELAPDESMRLHGARSAQAELENHNQELGAGMNYPVVGYSKLVRIAGQ